MKRMMLAAILAAAATGASAGDFDRGAVLSMSCAACHGTDGVSPGGCRPSTARAGHS